MVPENRQLNPSFAQNVQPSLVGVGVMDGVKVGVKVGVFDGVNVGVKVGVFDGVSVNVGVLLGVGVNAS